MQLTLYHTADGISVWKKMLFPKKIISVFSLHHLSPLTPNPQLQKQIAEYSLERNKGFFSRTSAKESELNQQ